MCTKVYNSPSKGVNAKFEPTEEVIIAFGQHVTYSLETLGCDIRHVCDKRHTSLNSSNNKSLSDILYTKPTKSLLIQLGILAIYNEIIFDILIL